MKLPRHLRLKYLLGGFAFYFLLAKVFFELGVVGFRSEYPGYLQVIILIILLICLGMVFWVISEKNPIWRAGIYTLAYPIFALCSLMVLPAILFLFAWIFTELLYPWFLEPLYEIIEYYRLQGNL